MDCNKSKYHRTVTSQELCIERTQTRIGISTCGSWSANCA